VRKPRNNSVDGRRENRPISGSVLVHLHQSRYSSAGVKIDPQSIAMESAFQPRRNHRNRGLEGFKAEGCHTTSLVFYLRGRYGFDLTVHRRFIPPTSYKIDIIPPFELPGPVISSFPTLYLTKTQFFFGELCGLRADFSSGVRKIGFEDEGSMGAPSQANGLNSDLEPVSNMAIHANFGFNIDFSAPVEKTPLQMVLKQQTENY
jgi:hypothetical protein